MSRVIDIWRLEWWNANIDTWGECLLYSWEIIGHVAYNYSISTQCYLRQAPAAVGEAVITAQKLTNYSGGRQSCISNCWACKAYWHAISQAIVRRHFIAGASRLILITSICVYVCVYVCVCLCVVRQGQEGEGGVWLFIAGHHANRHHFRSPKDPNWVLLQTRTPLCCFSLLRCLRCCWSI